MDFSYILEKIQNADFSEHPFKHIEIDNLFEESDFDKIINSRDINLNNVPNDIALFNELFNKNYRIIDFPGCTSNQQEYIDWHIEKNKTNNCSSTCEGFGVVLRLGETQSKAINSLQDFIMSQDFIQCIAEKFDIDVTSCEYDAGIQKYLDGYEISPHPDIRRKALTFMVNINSNNDSENVDYHTRYLKLKPNWSYVSHFWKGNENSERCWVPWEWCDVIKRQTNNNSIVIFSPYEKTIHAVKANYNHLESQRTQLYGNLWYKNCSVKYHPDWEDLIISKEKTEPKINIQNVVNIAKRFIPGRIEGALKNFFSKKSYTKTHLKRKNKL